MQNANTSRKNQKLLKSKADFGREQLADLLESLATPIREGEMTIGTGEAALNMDLPGAFRTTMELSLIHISEPTRREWLSRMPSSA